MSVAIQGPDGPRSLRAKFLAGCDGARSTIRSGLGLAFEGETYPETTLLATTVFPFEAHLEGPVQRHLLLARGCRQFQPPPRARPLARLDLPAGGTRRSRTR